MKIKMLLCAMLLAASLSASAADSRKVPESAVVRSDLKADFYSFFGDFYVEFDQFVYGLFLSQTNDMADAADVNGIPLVFNDDDDDNGFYMVFWLP